MGSEVLSRPGFSGRSEPRDPLLVWIAALRVGLMPGLPTHVVRSPSIFPRRKQDPEVKTFGGYAVSVAKARRCACYNDARGVCDICLRCAEDTWPG